jgi:hypothetical protein
VTNTIINISEITIDKLRTDLVRKIRLQRGVHDVFEGKARALLTAQKTINVVFTAFITLIVFADFGLIGKILPHFSGQPASITVGVISFIIFVMNALADVFGLSSRYTDHLRAIQLYSDLLRDIKQSKVNTYDSVTEREVLMQLNDRYMQITFSSLNVGGRRFVHGETIYLRRRALRLAKKEAPFAYWWTIRKRAQELVSECLDKEGNI